MNSNLPTPRVAARIRPEAVNLELTACDKDAAIHEVAGLLAGWPAIPDLDAFVQEIFAREAHGSTALGHGVAMPHARTDRCREMVIAVGRRKLGLDYQTPDGKPVQLLFLIGTPMQEIAEYLRMVGTLARMLTQETVRRQLLEAANINDFMAVIAAADQSFGRWRR